jgi:transcriptional regulator with XRE-family HTH domain
MKTIAAVSQQRSHNGVDGALPAASFGKRLASIRETRGLTSLQVSSAVGVSKVCVWKWEAGHMYPSPSKLQKLADTLQISVSLLVCGYEAQTDQSNPLSMLSFGERLVQLRTACRLLPHELGCKTNVSRMCIWKWENGRSHPRPAQLRRLAEALQTSVSMLTHGDHNHVSTPQSESLLLRRQIDHARRSAR